LASRSARARASRTGLTRVAHSRVAHWSDPRRALSSPMHPHPALRATFPQSRRDRGKGRCAAHWSGHGRHASPLIRPCGPPSPTRVASGRRTRSAGAQWSDPVRLAHLLPRAFAPLSATRAVAGEDRRRRSRRRQVGAGTAGSSVAHWSGHGRHVAGPRVAHWSGHGRLSPLIRPCGPPSPTRVASGRRTRSAGAQWSDPVRLNGHVRLAHLLPRAHASFAATRSVAGEDRRRRSRRRQVGARAPRDTAPASRATAPLRPPFAVPPTHLRPRSSE
jgi:hypothetical protein